MSDDAVVEAKQQTIPRPSTFRQERATRLSDPARPR